MVVESVSCFSAYTLPDWVSTLTAASEPSALKSSYFITSAMMKPFSKSVWILPAACGAFVPFCVHNNNSSSSKSANYTSNTNVMQTCKFSADKREQKMSWQNDFGKMSQATGGRRHDKHYTVTQVKDTTQEREEKWLVLIEDTCWRNTNTCTVQALTSSSPVVKKYMRPSAE